MSERIRKKDNEITLWFPEYFVKPAMLFLTELSARRQPFSPMARRIREQTILHDAKNFYGPDHGRDLENLVQIMPKSREFLFYTVEEINAFSQAFETWAGEVEKTPHVITFCGRLREAADYVESERREKAEPIEIDFED